MRAQLIERLRETIAAWEMEPRLALLFGSVARSEADAESDLDVLVVRRRESNPGDQGWRTQLLDLQQSATTWTGNDTRIVEFGEEELAERGAEPWLEDVLRDAVELFGESRTLRRIFRTGGAR